MFPRQKQCINKSKKNRLAAFLLVSYIPRHLKNTSHYWFFWPFWFSSVIYFWTSWRIHKGEIDSWVNSIILILNFISINTVIEQLQDNWETQEIFQAFILSFPILTIGNTNWLNLKHSKLLYPCLIFFMLCLLCQFSRFH